MDKLDRARWIFAHLYQNEQQYKRGEIDYKSYKHEQMKLSMEQQQIFQELTNFNCWILEYAPYLKIIDIAKQAGPIS